MSEYVNLINDDNFSPVIYPQNQILDLSAISVTNFSSSLESSGANYYPKNSSDDVQVFSQGVASHADELYLPIEGNHEVSSKQQTNKKNPE